MQRTGFTLIELLIVILIIAILAGAVLPFVQQYIEDSRVTRAKQDLDEIKNSLIRYETEQRNLYVRSDTRDLIGPYLMNAKPDPWGGQYVVDSSKSICYSLGPDGKDNTNDEVKVYYRPPLAITRAFWEDSNGTMAVDTDDKLILYFSRPVDPTGGPALTVVNDDLFYLNGNPEDDYKNREFFDNNMMVKLTLNFDANLPGNPPFRAGQDTIEAKNPNGIVDFEGISCRPNQPVLIKPFR